MSSLQYSSNKFGDSSEFEVIAINNTFYSDEMGLNSFEYIKGQSVLHPMSHGNTSDSLNSSLS